MSYIKGLDRGQTMLLPPSVEEFVDANAAVRLIDVFVDGLELEKLGFLTRPAETGRPAYHPAVFLKLYLYGYLNRVRSSRRLEAECLRNLEIIWLTGQLQPDHWTIAAFRREHRPRFKAVLREFNLLCRKLDLFGAELVAIDGAKFKAVNSPRRHFSRKELAELIGRIDARIEDYLTQMDEGDETTADLPEPPKAAELADKLSQLQERRSEYQRLQEQMKASGAHEISLTDPDSRGQKKVIVGYNVQVAVDAKHHLIAAERVEQAANDLAQLAPMAEAAKDAIGVTNAVADAGYHEAAQLEKCEQTGITTYVPAPRTRSGQAPDGRDIYPKENFAYDPAADAYRCPADQILPRTGEGMKNGKARIYYYNLAACGNCRLRAKCTTSAYRKLSRLVNEPVVERQASRLATKPGMMLQRKSIVEHVFGSMRLGGHDIFLCRGLESVRAEFSLSALAYNLRRVLNLCDMKSVMAVLQTE